MHIYAVIMPPPSALDEVASALDSARKTEVSAPVRTGFLGRKSSVETSQVAPDLDRIPVDQLHLPVAGFGNVTASDSRRIETALTAVAAELQGPELYFAETEVIDTEYGNTLAVKAHGDLDELAMISREMTRCVESLGFYVDRRRLRPWLEVARSNDRTTATDMDAAVAALAPLVGHRWRVGDVRILTRLIGNSGPTIREIARLPLNNPGT